MTKDGTGLLLVAVQRSFETNRLAKDFQARAYEQLVPLEPHPADTTGSTGIADKLMKPQLDQGGITL